MSIFLLVIVEAFFLDPNATVMVRNTCYKYEQNPTYGMLNPIYNMFITSYNQL